VTVADANGNLKSGPLAAETGILRRGEPVVGATADRRFVDVFRMSRVNKTYLGRAPWRQKEKPDRTRINILGFIDGQKLEKRNQMQQLSTQPGTIQLGRVLKFLAGRVSFLSTSTGS